MISQKPEVHLVPKLPYRTRRFRLRVGRAASAPECECGKPGAAPIREGTAPQRCVRFPLHRYKHPQAQGTADLPGGAGPRAVCRPTIAARPVDRETGSIPDSARGPTASRRTVGSERAHTAQIGSVGRESQFPPNMCGVGRRHVSSFGAVPHVRRVIVEPRRFKGRLRAIAQDSDAISKKLHGLRAWFPHVIRYLPR